jgi:hypothetical protein
MRSNKAKNTSIRSLNRQESKSGVNRTSLPPTTHVNVNVSYLENYLPKSQPSLESALIPEKYSINPLLSHVYNCELKALYEASSEESHRIWWLEDLFTDYQELSNLAIKDAPSHSLDTIFYPISELSSAGVISCEEGDHKNDAFLNMLMTTYKGTQRAPGSNNVRKKITYLSKEGVALKSLEFSNDKDYWTMIYGVKRFVQGQNASCTGRCSLSITNQNVSDNTFNTAQAKPDSRYSVFSKLTSSSTTSNSNDNANREDSLSNLSYELLDGMIRVMDKSTEVLSFKLDNIRAIAISVDCPKPSPYLMRAKLSDDNVGLSLQFTATNTAPLHASTAGASGAVTPASSNKQQKVPLTSALLLPLTLDQIERGSMSEEPSLLDTEKRLPYSITILSNLAVNSGNLDSANLGENLIPYASFVSSTSSTADEAMASEKQLFHRIHVGESITSTTVLREVDTRRGVRICVHNAMGLPSSSSRNIPPSAYCTIYLVGKNNDKLSLNTIESRTEIIDKSADPVWEKEFILEGGLHVPGIDTSGLDGVEGVMVKVRDASSGILKHHHIGQVVIPIHCFIYQTEAKFTLPLEPTYRMTKDDKYLGEISLTTELVTLESTLKGADHDKITGHQQDEEYRTRRLSIVSPREHSHYLTVRKPGSDVKQAIIQYSIYDTLNLSYMWWPCRTLFGGDAHGHIYAAHDYLSIKLLPGAGGVLTNCKEVETVHDIFMVTISWEKIIAYAALSDGVFMLTLTINHCTSLPSQKAKGELTYTPINLDLLVAPCPSSYLEKLIQDRLQVSTIRSKLVSFVTKVKSSDFSLYLPSAVTASAATILSAPSVDEDEDSSELTPNKRKLTISGLNQGASLSISPMNSPRGPNTRNRAAALWSTSSTNATGTAAIATNNPASTKSCKNLLVEAEAIYILIEHVMHHLLHRSSSSSALKKQHRETRQRWKCRYILYLSQLMSICKLFEDSIDGPSYRLEYVQKIVDEDCSDAQITTPLRPEANPKSLSDRHDYIFDTAIRRLREFLLCSGNKWSKFYDKNNISNHHQTSSPVRNSLSVSTSALATTPMAKLCIEELLSSYNNALRLSLFPYIKDMATFHRIEGQNLKNTILRIIIDTNSRLHEITIKILQTYGLTIAPPLILLDPSIISNIIDWYAQNVIQETKLWISRTFQQALKNKSSSHDIPWDIEQVGTKYISPIPETLRYQVNVYLELCYYQQQQPKVRANNAYAGGARYQRFIGVDDPGYVQTQHPQEPETHDSDEEEEESSTTRQLAQKFHGRVNEKILLAVSSTFFILCEEYRRALQSKHWDQLPAPAAAIASSPSTAPNISSLFLISIANDAYRILSSHLQIFHQKDLQNISSLIVDIHLQLYISYLNLAEKSIQNLLRILFMDLSNFLIEFDSLCLSEATIIRSITATLTHHFNELRLYLEPFFYLRLIQGSMIILIKRYLLSFKTRVLKNKFFSPNEIIKLQSDISALGEYYHEISHTSINASESEVASANANVSLMDQQYDYLRDVVDLLRYDLHSVAFATLIRKMIHQYHHPSDKSTTYASIYPIPLPSNNASAANLPEYYPKIPIAMIHCYLSLRNDYTSETESLVQAIYDESYPTASCHQEQSSTKKALQIPYLSISSTRIDYSQTLSLEDVYQAIFHEEEIQSLSYFSSSSSAPASKLGFALSSPVAGASSSTSAGGNKSKSASVVLKAIKNKNTERDSTLLLSSIGVGTKRKNEEYALNLYRMLGLEEAMVESIRTIVPDGLSNPTDNANMMDDDQMSAGGRSRGNSEGSMSIASLEDYNHMLGSEFHGGDISSLVDCSIIITQIQVRGLRSASYFTGANPYVAITLGPQRLKTSVKANTTDTEWKSTVLKFKAIQSLLPQITMYVRVYDKEIIRRKRLMGSVSIKLAGIDVRSIRSWYALEGGAVGSNGDIHLNIEFQAGKS